MLAFGLGLLLSFGALSGDEQGRVNLLALMLVFVVLPIASAALALASLGRSNHFNFAFAVHWLNRRLGASSMLNLPKPPLHSVWLALQSQLAAMAMAAGSLAGFFALLLLTDIHFVWRSTLLQPAALHQFLEFIAQPWWFWEAAQPKLAILEASRDFRPNDTNVNTATFGQWWPFISACLLVYAGLLRAIIAVILLAKFNAAATKQASAPAQNTQRAAPQSSAMAAICEQLPNDFAMVNWVGFSPEVLAQCAPGIDRHPQLHAGPLASAAEQTSAAKHEGSQLVLVKAWEPPLAELGDYLAMGNGLVYPIELDNQHRLLPASNQQLEEWRRFIGQFPHWRIYQRPAS